MQTALSQVQSKAVAACSRACPNKSCEHGSATEPEELSHTPKRQRKESPQGPLLDAEGAKGTDETAPEFTVADVEYRLLASAGDYTPVPSLTFDKYLAEIHPSRWSERPGKAPEASVDEHTTSSTNRHTEDGIGAEGRGDRSTQTGDFSRILMDSVLHPDVVSLIADKLSAAAGLMT